MKTSVLALLILVFVGLYIVGSFLTRNYPIDLSEPKFDTYTTDEPAFLKTFYLMDKGYDYYDAMQTAFSRKHGGWLLGSDAFTWRLPAKFYLWSILANSGDGILILFVIMAGFFGLSLFLTLSKLAHPWVGALGVLMLIPYFLALKIQPNSFLFTEWWALFFLGYALVFLTYRYIPLFGLSLLLAASIRELSLIPIVAMLFGALVFKKHRLAISIVICLFFIYYAFHVQAVRNQVATVADVTTNINIFSRFHPAQPETTYPMLAYFMQLYPFSVQRSYLLFYGLSAVSGVLALTWKRSFEVYSLVIAGWSSLLLFPFITTSQHTSYWGILCIPLVLSILPLGFYIGIKHILSKRAKK